MADRASQNRICPQRDGGAGGVREHDESVGLFEVALSAIVRANIRSGEGLDEGPPKQQAFHDMILRTALGRIWCRKRDSNPRPHHYE